MFDELVVDGFRLLGALVFQAAALAGEAVRLAGRAAHVEVDRRHARDGAVLQGATGVHLLAIAVVVEIRLAGLLIGLRREAVGDPVLDSEQLRREDVGSEA
eukprot:15469554-Alexandrium_andersonii.AAC.3